MQLLEMLESLRNEREQISEAIITLERLAAGRGRRRGRPPAWMSAAMQTGPKRRGRPPGSKNKSKDEEAPEDQGPKAEIKAKVAGKRLSNQPVIPETGTNGKFAHPG